MYHANASLVALVTGAAFAFTVSGCGPASTGTRHAVPSNAFTMRGVHVFPPADARAFEVAWLRETMELHLGVLDFHGVVTQAAFRLQFYRTLPGVQRAHQLAGGTPVIWAPGTPRSGWGFFAAKTLHVWAGDKLEGPSLAHHLLHVYGPYPGPTQHGTRWTRIDFDDWMVSITLAGRR